MTIVDDAVIADDKGSLSDRLRFGLRVARALIVSFFPDKPEVPLTLETAQRVAIADLHPGVLAKVVGTVRCFEEPKLVAPLSETRCAYYLTKLYEADEQRVLQETGSQSFYLDDEGGSLLVAIDEPKVELDMDVRVAWGMFDPLTAPAKRFLDRHERPSHDGLLRRDIRFEEGVIAHGERIAVFGRTRLAGGAAAKYAGYRTRTTQLLIEAPEGGRLHVTDVDIR